MSRFTNPRRWSTFAKRKKFAAMTEEAITPEEAREAISAIVMQTGHVLERLHEYDYRRDRFIVEARECAYDQAGNLNAGKLKQITVFGETVAKVVAAARTLGGTKKLMRPSDRLPQVVQ